MACEQVADVRLLHVSLCDRQSWIRLRRPSRMVCSWHPIESAESKAMLPALPLIIVCLLLLCSCSALDCDFRRIGQDILSGVVGSIDQFKQKCIDKTEVRHKRMRRRDSISRRGASKGSSCCFLSCVVGRSVWLRPALRLLVCTRTWPLRRRMWIR